MWDSMIKPTVVLVVVCLVISGSLAYVNGITKDVIEQSTLAEMQAFRKQVMDEADRFVQVYPEGTPEAVTGIYEGYSGSEMVGYVLDVMTKGYGGNISMNIGIDMEGQITGVVIGNNSETPGLGSKAAEPGFIDQFDEVTVQDKLTIVKQNPKAAHEIQAISGATVTSRGVTKGVQAALELLRTMTEGGK